MPKIYHYHPETKAYLGSAEADISPLDDKILVPANATIKAPPDIKDNLVPAFKNDAWELVEDRLGQSVWLPDGTEIEITSLIQDIPAGALDTAPDLRSFDQIKSDAIATAHAMHAKFLRDLTGNATIEERDTWQTKALAVEAIQAGTASANQQEMIAAEASVVGEPIEQLIANILAKYGQYQKVIGWAAGCHRKAEAGLREATNKEQVAELLDELSQQLKKR